jgi:hypothetical protein
METKLRRTKQYVLSAKKKSSLFMTIVIKRELLEAGFVGVVTLR